MFESKAHRSSWFLAVDTWLRLLANSVTVCVEPETETCLDRYLKTDVTGWLQPSPEPPSKKPRQVNNLAGRSKRRSAHAAEASCLSFSPARGSPRYAALAAATVARFTADSTAFSEAFTVS